MKVLEAFHKYKHTHTYFFFNLLISTLKNFSFNYFPSLNSIILCLVVSQLSCIKKNPFRIFFSFISIVYFIRTHSMMFWHLSSAYLQFFSFFYVQFFQCLWLNRLKSLIIIEAACRQFKIGFAGIRETQFILHYDLNQFNNAVRSIAPDWIFLGGWKLSNSIHSTCHVFSHEPNALSDCQILLVNELYTWNIRIL